MDEAEGYPEETVATTGDGSIAVCVWVWLLCTRTSGEDPKEEAARVVPRLSGEPAKEQERDGDWQRTADR